MGIPGRLEKDTESSQGFSSGVLQDGRIQNSQRLADSQINGCKHKSTGEGPLSFIT